MGKGKGKGLEDLEGLAGFDILDGFVVFIKGIGIHVSQWICTSHSTYFRNSCTRIFLCSLFCSLFL